MAKRYDEWSGENYAGSSARGAMKGWYTHGLCAPKFWNVSVPDGRDEDHAFAIIGYDRLGVQVQHSWRIDWGPGGFPRNGYDDWLTNGSDVWVAALCVPVTIKRVHAGAAMRARAVNRYESHMLPDLKPHIVTCRNDGALDATGDVGMSSAALTTLVGRGLPNTMGAGKKKRVMLRRIRRLVGRRLSVRPRAAGLAACRYAHDPVRGRVDGSRRRAAAGAGRLCDLPVRAAPAALLWLAARRQIGTAAAGAS